jgi:hypothetical protein
MKIDPLSKGFDIGIQEVRKFGGMRDLPPDLNRFNSEAR